MQTAESDPCDYQVEAGSILKSLAGIHVYQCRCQKSTIHRPVHAEQRLSVKADMLFAAVRFRITEIALSALSAGGSLNKSNIIHPVEHPELHA
jgi:hypothetical protein